MECKHKHGVRMKSKLHNSVAIHPGEFLKTTYLDELNLSMTEFAIKLGVSSSTITRFISGKSSLSVDLAMRLAKSLSTSPYFWLDMQCKFDIANYDESNIANIKVIEVIYNELK